ncbi:MAG: hypothetical protein HZB91_11555 [Elusimicrobia bacterium]|nr:hypothetical protein [Elusimicrobiota bacterium]
MIHRDWFKRHLEILTQALGAVLGLKAKGDIQAAAAAIETAIQKAFGMSGKLALGLQFGDFISLACKGEEPSAELLSAMSKLFQEWAELLEAQGRTAEASLSRTRGQAILELAGHKVDELSQH